MKKKSVAWMALAIARLAAVGDCMVCHIAKGGKPFAGGLAIDTPFGKILRKH